MPDLSLETEAGAPAILVAGVDEAGRGPLAGPVVSAAVVLPANGLPADIAASVDDSKALTVRRRNMAMPAILRCCAVGIGTASVAEIDRMNVLQATFLSMRRALNALPDMPAVALIDGNRLPKTLPCSGRAIVRGDSRSMSIAAASIVAKVTRDRIMAKLSESPSGLWLGPKRWLRHRRAYDGTARVGCFTPPPAKFCASLSASRHKPLTPMLESAQIG